MRTSHALRYFRDSRRGILLATALAVTSTTIEAGGLVMVASLAQSVAAEAGESEGVSSLGPFGVDLPISTLLVVIPVVFVVSTLLLLASNTVRSRMVRAWTSRRQAELVGEYLSADWRTQSTSRTGRLAAVNGLVNQVGANLANLTVVLRSLASVGVLVVVALLTDWQAALAISAVGAVLSLLLRPLNVRAKTASRKATRLAVGLQEELTDLSGLTRELRIFGVGDAATVRARRLIGSLAEQQRRMDVLDTSVAPVYQTAGILLLVAALGFVHAVGSSDVAALGAVALLVLRSISYGQHFQSAWQRFGRTIPVLDQLEEASRAFREARVVDGELPIAAIDHVRLVDVGFRYDPDQPAVAGISLDLRRGRILGIAGRSGAGKTTLAELLLRLLDPTEGEILVDGEPVGRYTLETWHRQVALVPQETALLRGTVTENIRLYRDDVDHADVERAAIAAGIHDTVLALPEGYDTRIGADYRGLSGGQRQRIGIARALAGRPSLLVLDEPTSALDAESEGIVHDTISRLRDDLAVVIIAHRLSTLAECDELLVLDHGRPAYHGPPATVLVDGTLDLARAAGIEDVIA